MRALKIGPGSDDTNDMGPLITAAHRDKVRAYLDVGIEEGAKPHRGWPRPSRCRATNEGFFLGGCLFDNVARDMRIYKEEIFGPVLSVVRAASFDEALTLVNDHEFGNGTALFTRDGHARHVSSCIECAGRHGGRQRADPGADGISQLRRLEALAIRRPSHARRGRRALLHPLQDRDVALARRSECRCGLRHAHSEMISRRPWVPDPGTAASA